MRAWIFSHPLTFSWPASLWVITKYWLAGQKENKRREGRAEETKADVLAPRPGQSITTLIIIPYSWTFLNWYKEAKTNKKICVHYEVCGLQDILRPDHISVLASWFPHASWRTKRWGDLWKGLLRQGPPPRSPGQPISSDDAFPTGKWIMSDQKPF